MKRNKFMLLTLCICSGVFVHAQTNLGDADATNTWFKVGLNTAMPITDFYQTNTLGIGLDASLQFLETKASGIGVKVGYLNYFGKESNPNISAIPVALMLRHYPESKGWFAGLELGYAFLRGLDGTTGGYFLRPQLGLHYDYFNLFGYYDIIATDATSVIDLQSIGIGVTYNIRFKPKN